MYFEPYTQLISTLLTMPLGLIYISILTDKWKFNKRITITYIISYLIVTVIIDLIIISLAQNIVMGKLYVTIFNIVTCMITYIYLSERKGIRTIFVIATACMFIFISDFITDLIVGMIEVKSICIKLIVFGAVSLLGYFFFRKPFQEAVRGVNKGWFRLGLVPISFCFALSLLSIFSEILGEYEYIRYIYIMICVSAFCAYMAFYHIFITLRNKYRLQEEFSVLKIQMKSIQDYTDTIYSMNEQICEFDEKIQCYLERQSELLDEEDIEGAKQVLSYFDADSQKVWKGYQLVSYTGNSMLDAVLSLYMEYAKQQKTKMVVHLDKPIILEDISEFTVALSNAVENALNACSVIPNSEMREIKITGRQIQKQFFLEIANTFEGKVLFDQKGHPITNRSGHGYGTQSIVSFVKKHNAILEYKVKDGWFKLRIIL